MLAALNSRSSLVHAIRLWDGPRFNLSILSRENALNNLDRFLAFERCRMLARNVRISRSRRLGVRFCKLGKHSHHGAATLRNVTMRIDPWRELGMCDL